MRGKSDKITAGAANNSSSAHNNDYTCTILDTIWLVIQVHVHDVIQSHWLSKINVATG